jgi:hypothetical protein
MSQFAGFCLGLFAAVMLLQLAQGGPTQLKAWLSSKFLGQPD